MLLSVKSQITQFTSPMFLVNLLIFSLHLDLSNYWFQQFESSSSFHRHYSQHTSILQCSFVPASLKSRFLASNSFSARHHLNHCHQSLEHHCQSYRAINCHIGCNLAAKLCQFGQVRARSRLFVLLSVFERTFCLHCWSRFLHGKCSKMHF